MSGEVSRVTYEARYHDDVIVEAVTTLAVRGKANVRPTIVGMCEIAALVLHKKMRDDTNSNTVKFVSFQPTFEVSCKQGCLD
jgi:hypothetical protein